MSRISGFLNISASALAGLAFVVAGMGFAVLRLVNVCKSWFTPLSYANESICAVSSLSFNRAASSSCCAMLACKSADCFCATSSFQAASVAGLFFCNKSPPKPSPSVETDEIPMMIVFIDLIRSI